MSALDSLDGVQRWVDKDPEARAVVTALEQAIREMRLTPAEVRSLAHYAAFRVEMYALRPFVVGRDAAESLFSRKGVESVERDRRRHFISYRDGAEVFDGKTISRRFNAELRRRGYKKVETGFWNARPALWVLPEAD